MSLKMEPSAYSRKFYCSKCETMCFIKNGKRKCLCTTNCSFYFHLTMDFVEVIENWTECFD